jgi:hypothetical protein
MKTKSGITEVGVLIIKLGATSDAVRTIPFLRRLAGSVSWVTGKKQSSLAPGTRPESALCLVGELQA